MRAVGVVFLLIVVSLNLWSAEAKPAMVPEGEIIPNIEELIKNIPGNSPVYAVAFSPDGKTIASASGFGDNTIRLWDAASGKNVGVLQGHTREVLSVAFSPDGKTIASGSWDKTIRLWDAASGKSLSVLQGHTDSVWSVAFSPDGKTIASGSWDKTIRLWDAASGKSLSVLQGHTGSVYSVAFSPDGKTIASGSWDKTIRLWDAASYNGKQTALLQGHTSIVTSVAFSPDGKTIASGSLDNTVRLWDAASYNGKQTAVLQGHTHWVASVAFSPDGKTIASGSYDNTVRLWDAASYNGKPIRILQGHTGYVTSVAFSPDGKTIASGSGDQTIRLWDAASYNGKPIRVLQGHTGSVNSVAFSPDGKTIASASGDRTIRLWDAASGKNVGVLQGNMGPVYSVAFSPDGKTIASRSDDRTTRLWNPVSGQEIKKMDRNTPLPGYRFIKDINQTSPDGKTRAYTTGPGDEKIAIAIERTSDRKRLWTCIPGQHGNWLSFDSNHRVWRSDDGTFLVNKDSSGRLSPVLPPRPSSPGEIDIIEKPTVLSTLDGQATALTLKIKNTGKAPVYRLNVISTIDNQSPLVFYRPDTIVRLDPGKTAQITCRVSAHSGYTDPRQKQAALPLTVSSDFTSPVSLEFPVNIKTPQLELLKTELQKGDKPVLVFTVKNTGSQGISVPVDFNVKIKGSPLDTVTKNKINAGEIFDLSFSIPAALKIDKNTRVDLIANKYDLPPHDWIFEKARVVIPFPAWVQFAFFGGLIAVILIAFYFLRLFLHPLTLQISKSPEALRELPPHQLSKARSLLRQTRRLDSILAALSLSNLRIEDTLSFIAPHDAASRSQELAALLDASVEPIPCDSIPVFQFAMSPRFLLNNPQILCVFPPVDMSAPDIIDRLKQEVPHIDEQICLFISLDENQNNPLRKISLETDNLFVTPSPVELTSLLLSPEPVKRVSQLIASQVKVSRISPYIPGGGVDKDNIFFGREQILAHILQRKPANYLVVGGRQLGKSSLLKAIDRKLKNDSTRQSRYIDLGEKPMIPTICSHLDLPLDSPVEHLFGHIKQLSASRHLFLLIDETDQFIRQEIETGYSTLRHFRTLSEEGVCHFILAGYWDLFHTVTFDFHSPIRNFGETIRIEDLEEDACIRLATDPMSFLNTRYESDKVTAALLHETGRRANLIAMACSEILRHADLPDRIIRMEHLEKALDCNPIYDFLDKWAGFTEDEQARRLDSSIVYATIRKETFTLADVLDLLETHGIDHDGERVQKSLARLELAYIIKREKNSFRYCVPLFKKIAIDKDPERLLQKLKK